MADSKDGIFPTADQVGGEVYPQGTQAGDTFPTDWEIYSEDGKKLDVSKLINGKRTVLAFFISSVAVSVDELKKLQAASKTGDSEAQLLFVNADLVGTGLLGGDRIKETARTVRVVKREQGIKLPMYVAPNDALDPKGLSNKLGFRGLPTVYVIGADGKVENVYVGPQDWSKASI
ncbi:MAG: TlpA family protein disulfide reductase [Gammaproteobacteria bacterium]|nr:TlpA family protein disulfide reductase [Gammaproteobacteria bacterium]